MTDSGTAARTRLTPTGLRSSLLTRSVLVCDFDPVTRRVLAERVAGRGPRRRVESVPDGAAAVEAFAVRPTDLVLIGVHAGTAAGVADVTLMLREHPSAVIVAFGSRQDRQRLIATVRCGALGWIVWTPDAEIRVPTTGFSPETGAAPAPVRVVSDLELSVLRALCEGKTNRDIGSALLLAEDTVHRCSRRLFGKLGARDRAHAVALGFRHGLVS